MEEQLFLLLRNRVPDLIKQEYKYERFDCYSKKYDMTVELKYRYTHYDDLLIQKDKYDSLLSREGNIRYICQTPKGIYSFDLRKIPEPKWMKERYPKSTYFDNEETHIDKMVGYIHISQSKKLD